MPKLRNLSGKDVIGILSLFGFTAFSQKGSHVKLRRNLRGQKQSLTVPNHKSLDKGTLRAIIRQASRFIPIDDPAKKRLEFNQKMIRFYDSKDGTEMMAFHGD